MQRTDEGRWRGHASPCGRPEPEVGNGLVPRGSSEQTQRDLCVSAGNHQYLLPPIRQWETENSTSRVPSASLVPELWQSVQPGFQRILPSLTWLIVREYEPGGKGPLSPIVAHGASLDAHSKTVPPGP